MEALAALAAAPNREEATDAAWELVDLALDGGGAVGEAAPEALTGVSALLGDAAFPWTADALSVVDAVAASAGNWRRAAGKSADRARYASFLALEDEVDDGLRAVAPAVRDLCRASDPEVRSMAAKTLGQIGIDPAADAELLRGLRDGETNALVVACLTEALVLIGSRRRDGEVAFDEEAVERALRDPSPVVRYRVARAVYGRVGGELASLVDEALTADPAEQPGLLWPAEV